MKIFKPLGKTLFEPEHYVHLLVRFSFIMVYLCVSFKGCPIEQLWKHLEVRKPPFPLKLDAAAKQFLWKAIVDMSEVEFFVLEEPFSHVFAKKM